MLAWTAQMKCRGLNEQPNDIWVATKSCNIKLVIGITLMNVNHNSSWPILNNWGLKRVLPQPHPNLRQWFTTFS